MSRGPATTVQVSDIQESVNAFGALSSALNLAATTLAYYAEGGVDGGEMAREAINNVGDSVENLHKRLSRLAAL